MTELTMQQQSSGFQPSQGATEGGGDARISFFLKKKKKKEKCFIREDGRLKRLGHFDPMKTSWCAL